MGKGDTCRKDKVQATLEICGNHNFESDRKSLSRFDMPSLWWNTQCERCRITGDIKFPVDFFLCGELQDVGIQLSNLEFFHAVKRLVLVGTLEWEEAVLWRQDNRLAFRLCIVENRTDFWEFRFSFELNGFFIEKLESVQCSADAEVAEALPAPENDDENDQDDRRDPKREEQDCRSLVRAFPLFCTSRAAPVTLRGRFADSLVGNSWAARTRLCRVCADSVTAPIACRVSVAWCGILEVCAGYTACEGIIFVIKVKQKIG